MSLKPAPIMYYFKDGKIPEHLAFRFTKKSEIKGSTGPEGMKNGLIVSPFEKTDPSYNENEQIWRCMNQTWIGVRKDVSPGDVLKQDHQISASGYFAKLGDGNDWLIPIAKLDSKNCSIPSRDMIAPDGTLSQERYPEYEDIIKFAEEIWDCMEPGFEGLSIEENKLRDGCISAVCVFYNLIPLEVFALGLLTKDAFAEIFSCIIDQPGWNEILQNSEGKKKTLRGSKHELWKAGLLKNYEPTYADL